MRHQEDGVDFLLERGSGLLAFEQGLGKTLVAIEAFRRRLGARDAERLLVICPNHLKRNWVAELKKFAPELDVAIVEGSARARRHALSHVRATVVITSYETARSEVAGLMALLRRARTVMVLDECHAVKNHASLTSTAAQHLAPLAAFRWLLSGTPVTNAPVDLFAQIGVVAAGRPFGTRESFLASYGEAAHDPAARAALAARVAPFLLRRTKDECLDLPEKTFIDVRVDLPDWQRALYDTMRDGIIAEVRKMSDPEFRAFAPTALSRLLRLAQLASNPALIVDTNGAVPAKFAQLDLLIDEIVRGNDRKVILWCHYVKTIEELISRYADVGVVGLYGGTPERERQGIAARFQDDPGTKLLIANPAVAGSGFTLTAASMTIYETLSWRYDFYAQSQDRNHRIGQTQPVTYLRLIAADTIEEVILAALARKGDMARALLGDGATGWDVGTMLPAEFCQMLTDGRLPG